VNASNRFHEALATGDYKGFCATKSASAETESDKQVEWTVRTILTIICIIECLVARSGTCWIGR
jgi:hypothetical protein